MLRPERMSRVSVTGSRRVMEDAIEAVHDLNLVHLIDYDGSWEGFDKGDPVAGADEASETLVTVRSIESILGLDEEDPGVASDVTRAEIEEELEAIRGRVNDLDDRRADLRATLREVEEEIDAIEPFVDLGIDLDLLSGYETLAVRVGRADEEEVREALADLDGAAEVFAGDRTVAVFAHADEDDLEDALVGVDFTGIEVPDGEGSPEAHIADLEDERERLRADLDGVEEDLKQVRHERHRFLRAAERELTIEVQKADAPLQFATTANAFIAEGWIPTDEYDALVSAMERAVGDAVEIEELERADYDDGHPTEHEAVADGGVSIGSEDPPVVQDNPDIAKPFETFVGAVGVPSYDELDPTVILFLTFPLFFGFMIGDLGYGLIYMGIGYWMMTNLEGDALRSMGGVGMWCGGFTVLFGVLYGELFGLHVLGDVVWGTAESAGLLNLGGPPLHKGLQPKYIDWALMWLAFSVFAGIAHLVVGWSYDFVNNLRGHGLKDAVLESGSWILMALGLWAWVFSGHLMDTKPDFLFNTPLWGAEGNLVALLPAEAGIAGFGVFLLGGIMVTVAEGGVGLLEAFLEVSAFGMILSYTRIAAVLVAKAGMALGVNLLAFGAYQSDDGAFHYIFMEGGSTHGYEPIFSGLLTGGPGLILLGVLVLVFGHAIVLALGVTSAGLQAVRLEYVEFFGEFYEGNGDEYEPFGYERGYAAED